MANGQESEEVRLFKAEKIKAEQGIAWAQYNLGWMYAFGEGVPQDDVESAKWLRKAAEWLRKAAEQGIVRAQETLASMYRQGDGVPQDFEEEAKWLRKAAEQGFPPAQSQLGEMYRLGRGVPKNDIEAYAWLLLAKANGIKESSEKISDIEKRLTAEQMEKGKARAAALHRLIEERKENPKPSVESP